MGLPMSSFAKLIFSLLILISFELHASLLNRPFPLILKIYLASRKISGLMNIKP